AGHYLVHAWMDGYEERVAPIDVAEGDQTPLVIDLGIHGQGCLAGACSVGLSCEPADGRCYPCVADGDCGASGAHCVAHACVAPGAGGSCFACRSADDCKAGFGCVGAGVSLGYCAQVCLDSADCPAGFACSSGSCRVPSTCLD